MRASRLLSILILLQLKARLTAEALAEEFSVSVRTIYRDIDALSASGVPIYGDRGPGGGFQLHEGYRTKLTGLGADEAEAMLMIGAPGSAEALGLGGAAARARGKLLAALPANWTETAGRIGERFHVDPVDWYKASEPATHAPALARATLDGRAVSIRYESWTGVRDFALEPLGLVQKAGAWYLVAAGAGKPRIFKLSNIHKLTVEERRFERPKHFDLADFWSRELQRFETELRKETATLLATPLGLKRLARRGAYAADAAARADPPGRDGRRRVTLPIESVEDAALIVLGAGGEIEAEGPEPVREAVAAMARAAAERHRAPRPAPRGSAPKKTRRSGR